MNTANATPSRPAADGFVAGTLVHTKEGLKPIEQINVGDWVLSKPESGEGEASYKRVVRTFESEDKEIYYVSYYGEAGSGFLIVTGNHPFWVINSNDYGVDLEKHPGMSLIRSTLGCEQIN